MGKRFGRNDKIFLLVIVIALMLGCLIFYGFNQKPGETVQVIVDGEVYGTYSLIQNQEVPIKIQGKVTNLLVIKDGKADVVEANCPDKLCVHQKAILHANETIVCLPNKVVVEIIGGDATELDAVI